MKKGKLQIESIIERLPRALAAAILASAMSAFVLTGISGAELDGRPLLYAMLLCAVFAASAEIAALNNYILIIGAAVFLCAGGVLLFVSWGNDSIYNVLINGGELAPARLLPVVLLLCGALCLAVCVIHRSFAVRCIIAAGLAVMLIMFMWLGYGLLTVPAVLITAYILIVLCQVCSRRLSCAHGMPRDMWFVMFSLVTAVIVFAIPHPDTRIQWEKLFEIKPTEQMVQLGQKLGIEEVSNSDDDGEYEIAQSGYSEDQSSLGGYVELVSDLCLQAEFCDTPHPDRLTGGIYDCYIGTGWVYTMETEGMGYISEVSDTDLLSASDLYGSVRISVTQESGTQQKTLFYPPFSQNIISVDAIECAIRDGARMTFEQPLGQYDVYYSRQTLQYELTEKERESCLALPEKLPARVRNLAVTATEGCEDDESKAQALMRVLSQYTYETYVRGLPDGRDFVDYFLFSSKKGYCAYFASSMAVMARCVGIPSRYVQGYYIGEQNEKSVTVTSDSAHAWAELYIDGCWVIYDPASASMDEMINTSFEDAHESKAEKNNSALKKILFYSYGATAACAVIFAMFRPFFGRLAQRVRTKRKHGHRGGYAVIVKCEKLLWVLSACGMKRGEAETLCEFADRVLEECQWIDEATSERLSELLALTAKALYSFDKCIMTQKENLAGIVRRAYIREFGLAKYLRGFRRAEL